MTERSTPSPAALPPQPHTTAGSIKETIESILIAFVLAFIFRTFVVEAFIIPTGSMAATLLGAHMRFQCPDCGYRFTVNYTSLYDRANDTDIPRSAGSRTFGIYCPNCGYKLPRVDPDDPLASATDTPVHFGDRILVLKYAYLFQEPQRGDVVVFKSPADYDPAKPAAPRYNINYIKRLIGKPGETVMILDGDIYVRPPGERSFQIQAKRRVVQDALWRIIYDNDFHPRRAEGSLEQAWRQPWEPVAGTGWDLGTAPQDGRIFRFHNLGGQSVLGFDPDANPSQYAFTDWLAYDVTQHQQGYDNYNSRDVGHDHTVSDLRLALTYRRLEGQGALELKLTKVDHTFIARISPTQVELWKQVGPNGVPARIGAPVTLSSAAADPLRIEFMNVDYRVTLRVNGKDLIQTTPLDYAPDMAALLEAYRENRQLPRPEVQIAADRQSCQVSHLSLWRDVYYINQASAGASEPYWGTPAHPIQLGRDEYFVLGDNSQVSWDARYWRNPISLPNEGLSVESGRVPGRFLLGKAFFVYWPAGFRPLSERGPGIVPNFGDMRFIH